MSCITGFVVAESPRDVIFPLLGDALPKPWVQAATGQVDGCLLSGNGGRDVSQALSEGKVGGSWLLLICVSPCPLPSF